MTSNFINSSQLLQYVVENSLYDPLVSQLRKDFSLANIYIDLPENIKPNLLGNIIQEKIYVLIMERFSEYLNLLYIIDIPERSFKGIQVTDAVEVSGQVTFLILKREFQKIRYREKYKK
ncbi:hypothetical protein [Maribacter sp. 2304DJ31-5]|uniref:hypothetical protein n=1 Tax=Maribacter sp. 2304DJ31-5 TaxID=3386273 RepID=UPI0039BC3432